MTTMTVREALRHGQHALAKHECPDTSPRQETADLLRRATGLTDKDILTDAARRLTKDQEQCFLDFLDRRGRHEPLAHITGSTNCLGREFVITPATLIPRPATEMLIEHVISSGVADTEAVVYDIGTGSGIIAIMLADRWPNAIVRASDTSSSALKIAEDNIVRAGLRARVELRCGNLLEPFALSLSHDRPAIFVANLPYLPSAAIEHLPPEIRLHEPIAALDGGRDGLDPYRALLIQIRRLVRAPRLEIFLEILPEQHEALERLALDQWPTVRTKAILNISEIQIGIRFSIGT